MLRPTHPGIGGTEKMSEFADLFESERKSCIVWGGSPLYSLFDLPTSVVRLRIEFKSARSDYRQGLRLKVRGGLLELNSVKSRDFAIWQDSAPLSFDVGVSWGKSQSRSIRFWNCWEVGGVQHAWTGNSGMRVSEGSDGRFLVRCSDGVGGPDFGNLVVVLEGVMTSARA